MQMKTLLNSEKAASNQNKGSDFIFVHVVCIETDNQMNSAAGFCLNRQLFADSFISQYQLSLLSLQVDKSCGSPVTSSCENSFRIKCPSSLPLVSKGSVLFLRCLFVIFCCDRKAIHIPCFHVIQRLHCMWWPMFHVGCRTFLETSLTSMELCSRDGRKWWRAAAPGLRLQIMTS